RCSRSSRARTRSSAWSSPAISRVRSPAELTEPPEGRREPGPLGIVAPRQGAPAVGPGPQQITVDRRIGQAGRGRGGRRDEETALTPGRRVRGGRHTRATRERPGTSPADGIGRAFAPAPHTAGRPGRRPADGGQVPWPGSPLRDARGHRTPRGGLSGVCPRVRAFTLTGEGGDGPPPSAEAAVRRRGGACRAPGSG